MAENAAHKTPDHESLQLPASFAGLANPLLIGGGVLLIVGMLMGYVSAGSAQAPRLMMSAYLIAYLYVLTIALGALFFVMIHHLVRAGWSTVVRRLQELLMSAIPMLGLLFIPIWLASMIFSDSADGTWLYSWAVADNPSVDPDIWSVKSFYFSRWFFTLRAGIYFFIWIRLTRFFYDASRTQDSTSSVALTESMQKYSGPAIYLFALTVSGAAFDWVMSLNPMWFSTMFGVYLFSGCCLSSFAALTVFVFLMQRNGKLTEEITVEHYHDLAKYMFGFVFFWTYIAFSQFMLIWYGNIPEETEWYDLRQTGGWVYLSIALVAFHFALPFLGLMARGIRRTPVIVFSWAIYLLVVHAFDLAYLVLPEAYADGRTLEFFGVVTTVLCLLGMIGLYLGLVLRKAADTPLIPARDPRLPESLAFENI